MTRQLLTEFDTYTSALRYLRQSPWRRRPFSYDALAEKMGYRSPRTCAMVINGQRLPSRDFVLRLGQTFGLNASESHYLELLVQLERLKSRGRDTTPVKEQLRLLRSKSRTRRILKEQETQALTSWCAAVLRELAENGIPSGELAKVSEKLRGKVSSAEISELLKLLQQNQILSLDDQGSYRPCDQDGVTTTQDIPARAIQKLHQDMLDRAREALTERLVLEREFLALTFPFDPQKTKEAKAALREFIQSFHEKYHSPQAAEVFQLNLQFFSHTDPNISLKKA